MSRISWFPSRRLSEGRRLILFAVIWLIAAAWISYQWTAYEHLAGPSIPNPFQWPVESILARGVECGTALVFVHPHCPCTRAGLTKMAKILHDERLKCKVYVVLAPTYSPLSAEGKTLAHWIAQHMPETQLVDDLDGAEAARFGATTSGFVVYYDPNGRLRFAGGLTTRRGGDESSVFERILVTAMSEPERPLDTAPVFGCLLGTKPLTDDR